MLPSRRPAAAGAGTLALEVGPGNIGAGTGLMLGAVTTGAAEGTVAINSPMFPTAGPIGAESPLSALKITDKPSDSFGLAQYAMERSRDIRFPAVQEFFEERAGEARAAGGKPPHITSAKFESKYKKYVEEVSPLYQTMMGVLKMQPGFVRVVSQNMHCRYDLDEVSKLGLRRGIAYYGQGGKGTVCDGEGPVFKDNQKERAIEFAKAIKAGQFDAHVIAVQELQHFGAKSAFQSELTKDGSQFQSEFPDTKTSKFGSSVPGGQGFVWNTSLVELISPIRTWQFPVDFTSGADAITSELSFKSCVVGRFKTKTAIPYIFTVFNIHPSPYLVDKGGKYIRGNSDIQIMISHIYQMTFVAMKMKELITKSEPIEGAGNKRDAYIVCGDWNINKLLQNGFNELDPGLVAKTVRRGIHDAMAIDDPKYAALARGIVKKPDNTRKTVDFCFRDDIPFTGNQKCDNACCGSEYLTVMEILQCICPTLLKSLPENSLQTYAPHGGRYTWDGLNNSVMYSPHWSSMSFQLIDHIVYSKIGHIPLYAHTMVKRYLTTEPILVDEGPLSLGCRLADPTAILVKNPQLKFYTEASKYIPVIYPGDELHGISPEYGPPKDYERVRYIDLADHYGIECSMVLGDTTEIFNAINDTVADFYKKAEFWKDNFRIPTKSLGDAKRWAETPILFSRLYETLYMKNPDKDLSKIRKSLLHAGTRLQYLPEIYMSTLALPILQAYNLKSQRELPWAGELPINSQKANITGFAFKQINRLLEREFLNRVAFTEGIPLGRVKLDCADATLYTCKTEIAEFSTTRKRGRGMAFKKIDKGLVSDYKQALAEAKAELRIAEDISSISKPVHTNFLKVGLRTPGKEQYERNEAEIARRAEITRRGEEARRRDEEARRREAGEGGIVETITKISSAMATGLLRMLRPSETTLRRTMRAPRGGARKSRHKTRSLK